MPVVRAAVRSIRTQGLRATRPAAACLLAVGLFACRQPADAPTVVEFWALGREGEAVQRLVPEFERQVPGVHVRVQQIPWSAAHEKLLTAYVGDAMPDVVQVGNTWLPEFVALRALEPLDGWMARTAVAREDYFPGILDTNIIDGVVYGLPWYVDTRLLFLRTDILRAVGYTQPPATWAEWLDAMVRIKRRSGPPHYAILLPLTEWQPPVILALQLHADLLRDHEQYGNFQSAAFRQAFAFYLNLFAQKLAPHAGDTQVANVYQDFASGYFSLYVSGPWNIGEFSRRLPAALQTAWSTAPLPAPNDGGIGTSLAGGASLALVRRSPHKAAAWQWIAYLSNPARQVAFYRLTGDLPARQQAWADATLAANPYAQAFWTQLQDVRSTPKIPEWERIANAISHYAEAAIRGQLTPDAALAALDRDVDVILEKRRWMQRASGRTAPRDAESIRQ